VSDAACDAGGAAADAGRGMRAGHEREGGVLGGAGGVFDVLIS